MLGAALAAVAGTAHAQLPYDAALLQPHHDSMVVSVQGKVVGWYTSDLARAEDGWHLTDQLTIVGFVQQRSEILVDRSGKLRRVQLGGVTNGIQIRASLEYRRDRVRGVTVGGPAGMLGDSTAPVDTSPVRSISIVADTVLPPGTIDDNALLFYLPMLPWAEGAHWTVPVFSGQENVIRRVTFAVRGAAAVALRTSTVDTWEVDATGGASPLKYYVSQSAPHRVVRMELTGVGLLFLLDH
ncbi:MAG: hypothetical protein JF590_04750 [Gemmatimonadetes bacterium]|nr:hypothetical protein [Gemmatimonadota bacterium]